MLDPKLMRFSAAMSSAVMFKGLLIFGGYWVGAQLDKRFNTSPLFLITLLLITVCLGLWWVLYVANKTKP